VPGKTAQDAIKNNIDQIAALDKKIEKQIRASVPRVIENYEEIKIRRAEFIGDVKLSNKED